jgi:hypothetical protein
VLQNNKTMKELELFQFEEMAIWAYSEEEAYKIFIYLNTKTN